MPDETPEEVQLMMAVSQCDFAFSSKHTDLHATASREQLLIVPGDKGFMGLSNSMVDQGLTVVEVLEEVEAQKQCSDFADRYTDGYIYCRWRSTEDNVGGIGWFHRGRIIPVPEDLYTELTQRITSGQEFNKELWKQELPEMEYYWRETIAGQISIVNVADPVKCENCDSTHCVMDTVQHVVQTSTVAYYTNEDPPPIRVVGIDRKEVHTTCSIRCLDCDHRKELREEELYADDWND